MFAIYGLGPYDCVCCGPFNTAAQAAQYGIGHNFGRFAGYHVMGMDESVQESEADCRARGGNPAKEFWVIPHQTP